MWCPNNEVRLFLLLRDKTGLAEQRITTHVHHSFFFFFHQQFSNFKERYTRVLISFSQQQGAKCECAAKGGGEGREKRGKREGDACHLWLFNFRQGSNHFWLRIQNRIKYAIDGNENILEENQIQHHKNQELLMIAVLLLF